MKNDIIWSRSRVVVRDYMEKLTETRRVELTEPFAIDYDFGNLSEANLARPPRLIWFNEGGPALEMIQAPPVEVVGPDGTTIKTTVPAIGYRRSNYRVRIWERRPDFCEVVLDQLVTASRLVARIDSIVIEGAPWKFITETEGRWLENGFALIDVTIGIRTAQTGEPRGSRADVIVQGSEFRAGIENPPGEPMSEFEYDVDRLTSAWPG